MKTKTILMALGLAALLAGCDTPTSNAPAAGATLSSIEVSPTSITLDIDETRSITVTAVYSDGSEVEITDATWSSDSSNATVAAGVITAVAATGDTPAVITATKSGKTATVSVTVNAADPVIEAPTALFSDSGVTFVSGADHTTTELVTVQSWNDDTINTSAVPATITFGSHNGWSGAVALTQKPSNMDGSYDLSTVKTIKFKIKSADIAPSKLAFVIQKSGDNLATLESLGASDLTKWNEISVDVPTLLGEKSPTGISVAFALFWGASAGDTSLAAGSYQIGDIQFLTAGGANANFYSTITPKTVPSAAPSAPGLSSSAVISLHNSSGTYTNVSVPNWNPGWGQAGSLTDLTVDGKVLKVLALGNYQGVNLSDGDGSTSGTPLNLTGKTTLHISYWTHDATHLNLYPINATAEYAISSTDLVKDAWTNLEIPIAAGDHSTFDVTTIRQLKFTNEKLNEDGDVIPNEFDSAVTIYLDNIYFH